MTWSGKRRFPACRVVKRSPFETCQTVGMNWKRAGWGAVMGVGGGNLSFGLSEDLPLFTVMGLSCLLFGVLNLRALGQK